MDPHSRFSHFNTRQTKAGPVASASRYMDQPKPRLVLDDLPTKKGPKTPSTPRRSSSAASLYGERPTVTNSRVKQDEQYRKDMHLAFVNNALQMKTMGISEAFDQLVDQFNPRKITQVPSDSPSPAPQLRLWILALSHAVSRLERVHAALVEAIVNMPWTTMDTSFVKSYTNFIGMLVSARPEYLSVVLGRIAQGLTHQSGLQALDSGLPESSSRPLTRRIVYDRIHYLLRHLIALVPTCPSTLHPLLSRNFPHKRQNQIEQVTYIRNLLRVTDYCPEIADRILALIIDRTIQIDVEIQVELEELEEQLDCEEQSEMFDLDPFDTVVGQEGESSDVEGEDGDDGEDDNLSDLSSDAGGDPDDNEDQEDVATDFKHIQAMVNKLDSILKVIFDHFNQTHASSDPVLPPLPSTPSSSSRSDSPSLLTPTLELPRPLSPTTIEEGKALRRAQFHTLLSIFDRTILRTFKSRYTQFIVFWYSSLDPEFADLFQGMLVSKALLEEDQPAVTRAAAASYIASFVSRAQFVDREGARRVVQVLCNFLRARLDVFEAAQQMAQSMPGGHGVNMNIAQHGVFYAVAQAVFLIFCFRWRDLLEDQDEVDEFAPTQGPPKKWMPELDVVQRVVTSELNPLKVCSSNVVMQFARVAHATGFVYCYSIMDANRRSDYAPSPPSSQATGGRPLPKGKPLVFQHVMTSELNTFFPFDPYKLPRSGSYIQGVYREWSSVAIDDEEEEEEEEEEDDEDDDEEEEAGDGVEDTGDTQPLGIFINGARAPSQPADDTDGLGESFGGMSISPARPEQLHQLLVV
ncbi:RNA polymerase I-specific transcription initiation factor RRN3 [Lentinus tigrinus ALCF2SS1-7]|uniref:RNA polymerase I-specific transcription initiation factor RRN3 n=1 Tax=Lentinus tigrinus ALCF2SS1-6 TaxID=1328759 RepID=A0A5C2STY4_9APHY|nr:RNA polymerase I-specific transcription initiation factor RRN3 [Lentinus tigrinus ALCF2SS1-6]RPD80869.1 RNA polymerase I-specific transcription initiation factor RRN3 [Lentinus tigrinus ALCF2SS1-7]